VGIGPSNACRENQPVRSAFNAHDGEHLFQTPSESLAPEWIVVRQRVDDRTLYLVHYRTECVTVTADSAEELADQIRNGAFSSADPDRVSAASRSSNRSTSSDMPSSHIVAEG